MNDSSLTKRTEQVQCQPKQSFCVCTAYINYCSNSKSKTMVWTNTEPETTQTQLKLIK